jgi:nitroimidazol reductase NimA-like FMN-containing flavoprotein (pyridoxamine 5'-phosphate oxidase superfamily)
MATMVRPLSEQEITGLLARDVVARVATIDPSGYPHVTPLWFLWVDQAFHFTSDAGRTHLARLRANPRAGLVIDVEGEQRADGERPNSQVRAVGDARLSSDADGAWTRRIWDKYISGSAADPAARLQGRHRVLIRIVPSQIVAVASV